MGAFRPYFECFGEAGNEIYTWLQNLNDYRCSRQLCNGVAGAQFCDAEAATVTNKNPHV